MIRRRPLNGPALALLRWRVMLARRGASCGASWRGNEAGAVSWLNSQSLTLRRRRAKAGQRCLGLSSPGASLPRVMARGRSFSIRPRSRGFILLRQVARHLARLWRVMARHLAKVTRPRLRRFVIGWRLLKSARLWPRLWPRNGRRRWPMRGARWMICAGFFLRRGRPRLAPIRAGRGGGSGAETYCVSIASVVRNAYAGSMSGRGGRLCFW